MQQHVPEAMMRLIEASPTAVAAHDKTAWLALFARHFSVEDPVGSRPVTHLDSEGLSRFYDTFIACNQIRFEVAHDHVGSDSVVRDLTIHITMAPAVSVSVPMHLLYEIATENGALKISRLAAHWELLPMIGQLLKRGRPAWPVMWSLSRRMLQQLGIKGMLGFSRAALTPRRRLYRQLDALVTAINCQDQAAVSHCLSEGTKMCDGHGKPLPLAALKGMQSNKVIAAGDWVSASVHVHGKAGLLLAQCATDKATLQSCVIYY